MTRYTCPIQYPVQVGPPPGPVIELPPFPPSARTPREIADAMLAELTRGLHRTDRRGTRHRKRNRSWWK